MINNNQEKNTNISTGTKSESNIYLKKSELPKNVSSFKNDAKYISESALTVWLKELVTDIFYHSEKRKWKDSEKIM